MKEEDSGLSCDYYVIEVTNTHKDGKDPYIAECSELMEALGLNVYEVSIFKEIWRQATARKGKLKKGNSALRGAEKIFWAANRNILMIKHEMEYGND